MAQRKLDGANKRQREPMSVIRLIDKTGSAKSWGPQDVVDALKKTLMRVRLEIS